MIQITTNMKKVIICLVLAMMSVAGYAQSVVGKWVTEGGDSQVEIYQSGDKLNGKIVWLKKGDGQLARKATSGKAERSTIPRTARPTSVPSGSTATT